MSAPTLPAGWTLTRERVTWVRWDAAAMRTRISHPLLWALTGPDDRGTTYDGTRREALQRMREEIADAADALETWAEPHDCDDVPCPAYGDECPWGRAQAMRLELEEVTA